jgi:DNA-binding transcriptional LysR family regulator
MELRDLDLNLLLVLDALFEEGTLTRTAQRLRLSQPTISASLARILGDELFVRANGRMQPTARALALRDAVGSVLKTVRLEILSQGGFDPSSERGAFTVSLSDIGELEFLPRLLSRLARDAPQAALKSVVATPVELSTAVDLGEIDLAVGYFPDLTTSVFKQQLLFQHSSACVVRRDHPTIGRVMTLDDYLSAKHVVIAQKGRIQDVVEVGLAAKGLHRRIGLQIPHFVSILSSSPGRISWRRSHVRWRSSLLSSAICGCSIHRFPSRPSKSSSCGTGDSTATRASSGFATSLLRCVRAGRSWASGE